MKLSGRDAQAFFRKPDATGAGVLIHGADASRVSLHGKEVAEKLLGPAGADEMRLTRLSAGEIRRDPAVLQDALKAQGFFPGQRVVLVEDGGDGIAKAAGAALDDWQQGDGFLIVLAGALPPRSSLRKLFEGAANARTAPVYDEPPGRADIEAALKAAGIGRIEPAALDDLVALGRVSDMGSFRKALESLALYKYGDETPVTSEDILAVFPQLAEAGVDEVVALAADGAVEPLSAALSRLAAQGVGPGTISLTLARYFRLLLAAASDPRGPDQALARARPPVFGPRRDRLARQARNWSAQELEKIVPALTDLEMSLRSSKPVPDRAAVERVLMRIAFIRSRN